jgi:hypothetical protein
MKAFNFQEEKKSFKTFTRITIAWFFFQLGKTFTYFLFFTNLLSKIPYKTLYCRYCKERDNFHNLILTPFSWFFFKIQKQIYFWCICIVFGIFNVFSKELKIKKIYFWCIRFFTCLFQNNWLIFLIVLTLTLPFSKKSKYKKIYWTKGPKVQKKKKK